MFAAEEVIIKPKERISRQLLQNSAGFLQLSKAEEHCIKPENYPQDTKRFLTLQR